MGLLNRISDYYYVKWDNNGHYPAWATFIYPYIHFCPGMDDLLVTDPSNCFCEYIPEELKTRIRKRDLSKNSKDVSHDF